MDTYHTLLASTEAQFTEKRSHFLAFAFPVANEDEAKQQVAVLKRTYYDARHVCYAYMLGAERKDFRAVDDGEPSSTAGKPILGQINSQELTNVLVVVVRYYGGVNLGTGGLIVAYRAAAEDAIAHATVEQRIVEATLTYTYPYPMMNAVMRVVKDMQPRIVSQTFDNTCTITLAIRCDMLPMLQQKLDSLSFE